MKRKVFLSVVLILLWLCAAAQQEQDYIFAIGPWSGVNLANVSQSEGLARVGALAGITSTCRLRQSMGISVDVAYSELGFKTTEGKVVSMTYLEVPVMLNVFVGRLMHPPLRPRLQVGLVSLLRLHADRGGTEIHEQLQSVGINLAAGYGIDVKLGGRVWFKFDGRAYTGVFDYRREEFQGDMRSTIKNVQFSIGFAYVLVE